MAQLIIGLIGQAGCGKGTVADYLRESYGAAYIRFSAILVQTLDLLAIEHSRDNLVRLSEALRQTFGDDALSFAIQQHALNAKEPIVVIDGIRRPGDIMPLEPLPQFQLVAIEADANLRFERMKKRGEKSSESGMTWEQFLAEEQRSTEVTIPPVMERADVHITNNGTQEELKHQVDTFLQSFGFTPRA